MKPLLDTHVLLWWIRDDPRLSQSALERLIVPGNELYLSSVSAIEIAAKVGTGKLTLPGSVKTVLDAALHRGGIRELPLTIDHAGKVVDLPPIHRDPFDHLLVAIALVTDDSTIRRCPAHCVW